MKIRRSITAQYGSVKAYAAYHGLIYDRLIKVLRGETLMRLEDIAQADRLLGGDLSVEIAAATVSQQSHPSPPVSGWHAK